MWYKGTNFAPRNTDEAQKQQKRKGGGVQAFKPFCSLTYC